MATVSYQGPNPQPTTAWHRSQPFPAVAFPARSPSSTRGAGTSVFVFDSSLPPGMTGVPYTQTLTAGGGTSPYSLALSSGSLPAGLSLTSATGAITGTPTATGSSTFTIGVTDAIGFSGNQVFTIVVASPVLVAANSGYTA